MNKRQILYCDIDGVIADFWKAIQSKNPGIDFMEGEEREEEIDKICITYSDIFENLDIMDKVQDYVRELSLYYEIYFLSTPMSKAPSSYTGKKIWIDKYFGEWAMKRLILCHRKDLLIGDYLIDDRTKNGAGEFTGKHIHIFTEEFPTWESVLNYLLVQYRELHREIFL